MRDTNHHVFVKKRREHLGKIHYCEFSLATVEFQVPMPSVQIPRRYLKT